MAKIAHYSPEDVTVIVAGLLEVKGFVSGTFISIEKDEMPYITQKTSDGRVARLSVSDQTYQVKITLHSMSDFNSTLTNIWMADELTGMGKFPLTIKDNLGNSLFFSGTSWVSGVPVVEYGLDVSEKVWTFTATQCSNYIGGNEAQASKVKSLINGIIGGAGSIAGALSGGIK